jgi:hypothetical protein
VSSLDRVAAALSAAGVEFLRNEDPPILTFPFEGDGYRWPVMILANDEARVLVVYSTSPVQCPPERRAEMYDFLHRANRGFTHGAFEIDHHNGDIRFRVGVDLRFTTLSDDVVRENVRMNVSLFQHGLRGIVAVANGKLDAKHAIAMLEPGGN